MSDDGKLMIALAIPITGKRWPGLLQTLRQDLMPITYRDAGRHGMGRATPLIL